PVFIEEPQDFIVRRNTGITLRCSATGSPYPKITWLKNGKLLVIDPKINPRLLLIGGALYITKVTKTSKYTDAGIYQCMAKNQFGSVFSRNATITIAYLRDKFRISPSNITITTSGTAKLTCHAPRANPKPSIMWEKNGKIIQSGGRITYTTTPESVLTIPNVDHYDLGFYVCVAENLAGVKRSEAAYLTVNVDTTATIPVIKPELFNKTVFINDTVTIKCNSKGDPQPIVYWRKNDQLLKSNDTRVKRLSWNTIGIKLVQTSDQGWYMCGSYNNAGLVTSVAYLRVVGEYLHIIFTE
ncbi:uncharacterized protein TRIADDRAFT_24180, partial [Trichoplax adhaerens]